MGAAAEINTEFVVNAAGAWADGVAERAGLAPAGLQVLKRTAFVSPFSGGYRDLPLVAAADSSFYNRFNRRGTAGWSAPPTPNPATAATSAV